MKTLRISVDQISEYSYLEFGERGENAVIEVILDFASWVEEFGECEEGWRYECVSRPSFD